jgi:hypothetical protein
MKKIVEEITGEGLEKLLGEIVTLYCCRYIYCGKLVGVSETDVLLENPGIVYETGPHDEKDWKNFEPLPNNEWFVKIASIESYGVFKCII